MTIIWCMVPEIWSMMNRIFCQFGPFFCPFNPPNNPKTQNFKKLKKMPGDIIILHMCTINDNHIMYGSWDMKCDRQNFLSFWTIFCHLTPTTTPKIKILKSWKNTWRYHHFKPVYQKTWSYALLFLRYGAWQMKLLFFILGFFLPFYSLNSPKNQNFKKMKKNIWKHHHFTYVYHKLWLDNIQFLGYGAWQTDRQTDGWKKWHIEVSAPPKNNISQNIL